MTTSDEHLEKALADYTEEIMGLRTTDSLEELMEALTCRGTISLLLEDFDACVSDADEAMNIYDGLVSEGKKVDPGIAIKNLENRGQLNFDSDTESMVSDYRRITELLKKIGDTAKFYPRREMIVMCLDCASDLVDKERFGEIFPFAEKAMDLLRRENGAWGDNRKIEALNILGQFHKEEKRPMKAIECFGRAIDICLLLGKDMEDRMELAFAYINVGDIFQSEKETDGMIANHENAIRVLEEMNGEGKLDDVKLLVDLHQGIAAELMEKGKIRESEKHLMAAMDLGMPSVTETMKNLGIKKSD